MDNVRRRIAPDLPALRTLPLGKVRIADYPTETLFEEVELSIWAQRDHVSCIESGSMGCIQ